MTIDEHITYWIESADDDLESAIANYDAKRYNWCLFIGHLILEKALKAFYVKHSNNLIPPKTHNLLKLAELSKLELTHEQAKFFADVNRFQIEARYAEFKIELYKIATEEFTLNNFNKIKEYYKWLKSLIK